MPNWYVGRERVKRAVGIKGTSNNAVIDPYIEAASRTIDKELGRRFIPKTEKRNFRWPQDPDVASRHRKGNTLYLDEDLLSLSALTGEGDDETTIPTSEVLLEPSSGPPYSRLEIDGATTDAAAVFQSGDTPQRAIRATGSWGYGDATKPAGAVRDSGGINDSVTSLLISDGSLVDVGNTLLIGTERLFVSERTNAAEENSDLLDGALTADAAGVSVTVDDGSRYNVNEMILVDSERMFIEAISGNVLTVVRAYDGSTLAAHNTAKDVHVFRTLTVTRGENGTTAATHDQAVAITKYAPPADIVALCQAIAISEYEADKGGRTGVVGAGEASIRLAANPLAALWEKAKRDYLKLTPL